MDLDARAQRAADDLRRQVESDLDVGASRSRLDAARRRHRVDLWRARGAIAALAVVVLVGIVAGTNGRSTDDLTTDEMAVPLPDSDGGNFETSARGAAILNALPRGPIDGRASWRLPVVVEPQSGLREGQTVTVYGRGFEPEQSLGIVQCTSEADTGSEGVGACQLAADGREDGFGAVTYATASREGTVAAKVTVRRYVETPNGGRVDCFSAPERCLLGVGAVSNYDQSGGAYINFAEAPPFTEPVLTVDPAGPHAPGQSVRALVTGFAPGRAVRVQQCRGERCQKLADGKSAADGTAAVEVVLQERVVDDETGKAADCDGRCTLRVVGIGVEGASSAPMPDPVALDLSGTPIPTTSAADPPTTEPPTSEPVTTTSIVAPDSTTPGEAPPPGDQPGTDDPVTTTSVASSGSPPAGEEPVTTTAVVGSSPP